MVAVALPETVDVPFMVPLAWPVPERVPVAFPGAAVGAADLAAVPEALCAAEDAATDVAMGAGGLAADAAGFGVANEAWLAAAPEPEADAFAGTARLPDPLLMLKPL